MKNQFKYLLGIVALLFILGACSAASDATESTTLVVQAADGTTLPDSAVAQAKGVAGTSSVNAYLMREFEGWAVVGLNPGSPLYYPSGGKFWRAGELEAGRDLEASDTGEAVIVLGLAPGGDMAGMTMATNIGSSVDLEPDLRVRIVGRFAPPAEVPEHFMLMPLDIAQATYDGDGQVSHLFVTLESGSDVAAVQADLEAALETAVTITQLTP